MAKTLKTRTFQSSALQYTYDRYIGNDAKRIQEYEEEVLNAEIARKVYDLRTKAGISQRELARRVGTSASAICRLEASDYEGHSLYLLKRIAAALDRRIEIRFVPVRRNQLKTACSLRPLRQPNRDQLRRADWWKLRKILPSGPMTKVLRSMPITFLPHTGTGHAAGDS